MTVRKLPVLLIICALPLCIAGCALDGMHTSLLSFALAVSLAFVSGACRRLADTDTKDLFLLRWLAVKRCSNTVDYTRSFNFASVDPLSANIGYTISGGAANPKLGRALGNIGDFNGDGIADIAVSSYSYSASAGAVYIVFGQATPANVTLDPLPAASTAVRITGLAASNMGKTLDSVRGIGDINGDGLDDLLMGGYYSNTAFVVFGSRNPANVNLATLTSAQGVRLDGPGGYTGTAVAAADVNGDGIPDLLIGEFGYGTFGRVYVVYGSRTLSGSINLATIAAPNGFILTPSSGSQVGQNVYPAGDLNKDGIADFLVGEYTGKTYVVFGRSGTSRSNLDTATMPATDGYVINGAAGAKWTKSTGLVSLGDVDGDGIPDIGIGGEGYSTSAGGVAVLHGNTGALSTASMSTTQGTMFTGGAGESAGHLGGRGDFNGDGYDDLLIGARLADPAAGADAGAAYLIFGRPGLSGAALPSLADGVRGFRMTGTTAFEKFGATVQFLSDVNGDSCTDLAVSASYGAGKVYIIFGGRAR